MSANNLMKSDDGRIARPLRVLVPLIQDDLKQGREAAEQAGMPHYQAAGEKLLEARSQIDHGGWSAWIERNFHLSQKTASRYMALATAFQNGRRRPFSTLTEVTEPNRGTHQPTWHEPVREVIGRVDTKTLNLKREDLKRVDERDAQKTLALQLIDIGYKVLARTLHPDKGGSKEAMARLNAVRDRLKQHV